MPPRTQNSLRASWISERLRRLHIPRPAKKDPHRSPLVGLRDAFWLKAGRWGLYRMRDDEPPPRMVPIEAILAKLDRATTSRRFKSPV
jgi:hypothetical protein